MANVNCLRHFRSKFNIFLKALFIIFLFFNSIAEDFYSLKPPRGISGEHLRFDLGMDCDCMPSCSFLVTIIKIEDNFMFRKCSIFSFRTIRYKVFLVGEKLGHLLLHRICKFQTVVFSCQVTMFLITVMVI